MSLDDDPFGYRITKDGRVLVSRGGRLIVTVGGAKAERLVSLLGADEQSDQQLLARVMGNCRRGDERRPARNEGRQFANTEVLTTRPSADILAP